MNSKLIVKEKLSGIKGVFVIEPIKKERLS
jgi:hypothetical protein